MIARGPDGNDARNQDPEADVVVAMDSGLFAEFREGWPNRPYPMAVDHLDTAAGRVCPAASLYAFGKVYSDRLKTLELEPGQVVACFPTTWLQWIGMLQGCLRRGAVFAALIPNGEPRADRESWCEAVQAGVVLGPEDIVRRPSERRLQPFGIIAGPPALAITEAELLEVTNPAVVDPALERESPVWLDARLAPLAEVLAVVTLLRAKAELHLGLGGDDAFALAADDHRWFSNAGASCAITEARLT